MNTATTHFIELHKDKTTPLVMIHGFRGTHDGLKLIAEELKEYHIIIPDLPGFGKTPELQGTHDLESYVEWLKVFIADRHFEKTPVLLGHSFGSIVSASYASKYPETIDKLILVNPIGAPALEGPKALLTQLALFYYWLGRKLPDKTADLWLSSKAVIAIMSQTMTKTKDKKTRQMIFAEHYAHFSEFVSTRSVSEAFTTSVTNNVRQTAGMIRTSTLLIAGDKDDITPLKKQQELVELFPDARLETIYNVGHLTHYETPKEVAGFIRQFISR